MDLRLWPLSLTLVLPACGRLFYAEQSPGDLEAGTHQTDGTARGHEDAGPDGDPPFDGETSEAPDASGMEDASVEPPVDAGEVPPLSDGSVTDGSTTAADGGLPDGASADAGSTDAGPSGEPFPLPTAISCAGASGVLSCDNFDGSASGASMTLVIEGEGAISTGGGFTMAETTAASSRAVVFASFPAITSGQVFMRFSLYVPSYVEILGLNVANLGNPDTPGDFGLDLNLVDGGLLEVYGTGGDYVINGTSTYLLPRDRWLCVRFDLTSVSNAGAFRVSIDGQQVVSASGLDTLPSGGVVGATAGVDWTFDGQTDATVYLDNLLVTTSDPGGCP